MKLLLLLLGICIAIQAISLTKFELGYEPDFNNYTIPITTKSKSAQHWFDRGMMQEFGFNQQQSRTAFQAAIEADPTCAMCYWGLAYAYGPFLNKPTCDPSETTAAYQNMQYAQKFATGVSDLEQALIAAQAIRFNSDPAANQTTGYRAYADMMAKVAAEHSSSALAWTLYGESLMDLWAADYYDAQGQLRPDCVQAQHALELANKLKRHPMATHLYIHLIEPSAPGTPGGAGRAEDEADTLRALNYTGSGHLEHMPGHLYLRVGRYHDAYIANVFADNADQEYLHNGFAPYGPGHNLAFGAYAACMSGESAKAIQDCQKMRQVYTSNPDRPDGPSTEGGWNKLLTTYLRFGMYQQVLSDDDYVPETDVQAYLDGDKVAVSKYPYAKVVRHYARGIAASCTEDKQTAETEYQSLQTAIGQLTGEGYKPLAIVANLTLAARMALSRGNNYEALALLQAASEEQLSWHYFEPPRWHIPVRQCVGQMQLNLIQQQGHVMANAAELTFNADLAHFIDNAYSLYGLVQAMEGQPGKYSNATINSVRQQAMSAWKYADTPLSSACIFFQQ